MIIERDFIHSLQRFLKRREYIAITGPRQAGKTTFLEIIKEYLLKKLMVKKEMVQTVTFEDRMLLSQFDADPISFVNSYLPPKTTGTFYFMIDEFQYSQEGGQKLKLIYDTIKNLKIIITGSSSLDIKAQAGRYLVGRILTFNLYPFNFGEFLRATDQRLEKIYLDRNKPVLRWLFENKAIQVKARE